MAAKVFVSRLGFTVPLSFLRQAIKESVQELGYENPTLDQEEAVLKFVSGWDVFVSLPTGSGKSVCFACLSIVFDKIRSLRTKKFSPSSVTIVISPLNTLMQDQVAKFSSKGVVAAFVGGLQVNNSVQDEALSGTVQLLYFSPEVLLSMPVWREMLRSP